MRINDRQIPAKVKNDWRVAIVHSSYYGDDVKKMVISAKESLMKAGIKKNRISVYEAAGTFEIPLIGAVIAEKEKADAIIGFGIVVQGETYHAQTIVSEAARGMMDVQTKFQIPFAFEVLYADSLSIARKRLKTRGEEAAKAVLSSLGVIERIND